MMGAVMESGPYTPLWGASVPRTAQGTVQTALPTASWRFDFSTRRRNADEGDEAAAEAIDEQVALHDGGGTDGAIRHAFERVEDDGTQDFFFSF